ncbi:TPA: RidA family protein [Candidatus Poribacteria bacterium]|nr:RidA family protein [Candidatus Poribacteria bacterium]HIA69745.1 RidA family protein [Candidatus Poribacteria bacterium]HIC18170.1 RidA family protein [Candidatus Poribacteria bacterium]HIM12264.1 RidA family protein [Candidatus Poribacteria bacterium]HIO08029.1 RidA family protein [Candidatus Poribacteria bacterium]
MKIENRLEEIGIELPPPVKPVANYVTTVQTGNLVFTSGHGPVNMSGELEKGQLGTDMTIEEGYQSARLVGLGLISTLKDILGDLDRIKRVIKVVGFVNSTPDFLDHPKVVNGVSDLFVEVFGDKGKHARSAVGMVQLPGGIPVEVEVIVEIED